MLNLYRSTAILILSATLAAAAHAKGPDASSADYGKPVPDGSAQRTIELKSGARHVNVVNGETVTFSAGGKRFSWHVDTYPHVQAFSLAAIAPADIGAAGVTVHVAPNPLYVGN